MRIAVLGAGVVGVNLATRFATLGHPVTFGARDVTSDKVRAALDTVPGATAASIADAVAGADLAVVAVPFVAVGDVVAAFGDPGATVIVDATNAVGMPLPDGVDHVAQLIERAHPGTAVVKAFNTIGAATFLRPQVDGQRYFLPIAGPAAAADTVRDLAAAMGFDAVVIGDLAAAPLLESHAHLWMRIAFGPDGGGPEWGFARIGGAARDG